jgi:hypothetical protein
MSGRDLLIRGILWRTKLDGTFIEDISDILIDASVEMNLDRDVKLQARIRVRDPDRIRPLTDVLALSVGYTGDDGVETVWQLGSYVVTTPPATSFATWSEAEYSGDDLTMVMATSAFKTINTSPAGTNVVTEIKNSINNAGLARVALPASSRTFRKAWTFPAGTTRLEKCNRILDHIAWYRLFMTRDGTITSPGPYVPPERQQPYTTWTDDDLLSTVEYTPSDAPIANVVIVVRDDPSEGALVAVARNDDPNSRSSTVSVGREIVRVETTSDIHSQADADALAARLLNEARQRYETVQFTVYPDPRALDPYQTVRLAFTAPELVRYNGVWRIRTASLGIRPDSAPLQVELSRVQFDGGTWP